MATGQKTAGVNVNLNATSNFDKVIGGAKSLIKGFAPFIILQMDSVQKAINKVTDTIGVASAATAASLGVIIKITTDTAARVQVLGTVMNQVAMQTQNSVVGINKYAEGIKNAGITTAEARMSLVRFMQGQIDVSKATDLARTSQDLAVIAGKDSSETYGNLIDSISSLNTMTLNQYGLTKNLNEILQMEATRLQTTVDKMTEAQAKTAMLNYILKEGKKVAGAYGEAMGDVGKKMTSLNRYIEELKNAIGKELLPQWGLLVDIETAALKGLTEFFEKNPIVPQIMGITFALSTATAAFMGFIKVNGGLAKIIVDIMNLVANIGMVAIAFIGLTWILKQQFLVTALTGISALVVKINVLNASLMASQPAFAGVFGAITKGLTVALIALEAFIVKLQTAAFAGGATGVLGTIFTSIVSALKTGFKFVLTQVLAGLKIAVVAGINLILNSVVFILTTSTGFFGMIAVTAFTIIYKIFDKFNTEYNKLKEETKQIEREWTKGREQAVDLRERITKIQQSPNVRGDEKKTADELVRQGVAKKELVKMMEDEKNKTTELTVKINKLKKEEESEIKNIKEKYGGQVYASKDLEKIQQKIIELERERGKLKGIDLEQNKKLLEFYVKQEQYEKARLDYAKKDLEIQTMAQTGIKWTENAIGGISHMPINKISVLKMELENIQKKIAESKLTEQEMIALREEEKRKIIEIMFAREKLGETEVDNIKKVNKSLEEQYRIIGSTYSERLNITRTYSQQEVEVNKQKLDKIMKNENSDVKKLYKLSEEYYLNELELARKQSKRTDLSDTEIAQNKLKYEQMKKTVAQYYSGNVDIYMSYQDKLLELDKSYANQTLSIGQQTTATKIKMLSVTYYSEVANIQKKIKELEGRTDREAVLARKELKLKEQNLFNEIFKLRLDKYAEEENAYKNSLKRQHDWTVKYLESLGGMYGLYVKDKKRQLELLDKELQRMGEVDLNALSGTLRGLNKPTKDKLTGKESKTVSDEELKRLLDVIEKVRKSGNFDELKNSLKGVNEETKKALQLYIDQLTTGKESILLYKEFGELREKIATGQIIQSKDYLEVIDKVLAEMKKTPELEKKNVENIAKWEGIRSQYVKMGVEEDTEVYSNYFTQVNTWAEGNLEKIKKAQDYALKNLVRTTDQAKALIKSQYDLEQNMAKRNWDMFRKHDEEIYAKKEGEISAQIRRLVKEMEENKKYFDDNYEARKLYEDQIEDLVKQKNEERRKKEEELEESPGGIATKPKFSDSYMGNTTVGEEIRKARESIQTEGQRAKQMGLVKFDPTSAEEVIKNASNSLKDAMKDAMDAFNKTMKETSNIKEVKVFIGVTGVGVAVPEVVSTGFKDAANALVSYMADLGKTASATSPGA